MYIYECKRWMHGSLPFCYSIHSTFTFSNVMFSGWSDFSGFICALGDPVPVWQCGSVGVGCIYVKSKSVCSHPSFANSFRTPTNPPTNRPNLVDLLLIPPFSVTTASQAARLFCCIQYGLHFYIREKTWWSTSAQYFIINPSLYTRLAYIWPLYRHVYIFIHYTPLSITTTFTADSLMITVN